MKISILFINNNKLVDVLMNSIKYYCDIIATYFIGNYKLGYGGIR